MSLHCHRPLLTQHFIYSQQVSRIRGNFSISRGEKFLSGDEKSKSAWLMNVGLELQSKLVWPQSSLISFNNISSFWISNVKKRSPSSEFMYNEVWPKVKNTNSKHSSKGTHEELKAGSWTPVRNKDTRMLVKQEAITRTHVRRPGGESRLGLQSKGRKCLEFSWDGPASNQTGHQWDLCMPSQSKDPSIMLPRVNWHIRN